MPPKKILVSNTSKELVPKNTSASEDDESYKKEDAISWVLHALKIIIGDEDIRQEILTHYHPRLHHGNITKLKKIDPKHHKAHIFTFNAFVDFTKGDSNEEAIEKKRNVMRNYMSKIIEMDGTIVFTATNIQQDDADFETHFQTFIIDNADKTVYIIDPAFDKTVDKNSAKYKRSKTILVSGQGIYYAEVAHEVVKPFFEEENYNVKFISLSHPAQIQTNDVFCQSWSLFILNSVLDADDMPLYKTINEFVIPEPQIEKYGMILAFYKRIFRDIPTLKKYLKDEYKGEIKDNLGNDSLITANPVKILMEMTNEDMV